ncbi:hypothetical protein M3Y99_00875000 [Aphelenchoides fujianensis]|nr:hypothetical protein M3Y99_00875000 [Aphelenchoides fujianensis]
MQPSDQSDSNSGFLLPSELQLNVFRFLNAEDVDSVARVCHRSHELVRRNRMHLERHESRLELSSEQIRVERHNSRTSAKKTFSWQQHEEFLACMKLTRASLIVVRGPLPDEHLDRLISALNLSKQHQILSFTMQSVVIESSAMCNRLYQALVAGNCRAIAFENCRLSCGFSEQQVKQLHDLCQFTVKNCKPSNGLGILGQYLSKLAADMRFKPRSSVPFYAEAPNLRASEICQFIKTWIHISEAPVFQIYVDNCDPGFMSEFKRQCEANELTHFDLEFKSKSHPWAHCKANFDERTRRFQLHPVFDVPTTRDRSFCRVRHFRDF